MTAIKGMSDPQIGELGRWKSDAFKKSTSVVTLCSSSGQGHESCHELVL